MIERSKEYQEGYDACHHFISRTQNPYGSTQTAGPSCLQASMDWHEGWNKRFFNEDPDELP